MSATDSETTPVKPSPSSLLPSTTTSTKDAAQPPSTTSTPNPTVATIAVPPTSTAATTSVVSSPLQTALDFWSTFDLNGRRVALDTQGLLIADRQETSAASRKQLSANTRNFRRSYTEGSVISSKDVGSMVRAYQTEIDSLTNRSKQAEASFISIYKALYDAPDPVETLSQAIRDSHLVSQLREQISKLREERGDLFERSANTNVLEKKIMDLETELRNSDVKAKNQASLLVEQEQFQWISAQKTTIEAYEMREQELSHQVQIANENFKTLQANSEDMQQQLNDTRSQLEHFKSTRSSVNDLAVEDLERTRTDANSLRRRCRMLENRLEGRPDDFDDNETIDGQDGGGSSGKLGGGSSALLAELAARDVQVSQLKDQVSTLEEVLGSKDMEKRNEFAKLSTSITEKDSELGLMREKLDKFPSVDEYETMKRQFETLQSFQMLDAIENEVTNKDNNADGTSGGVDSVSSSDSLERRLLNKVKALEGRLMKLRVEVSERDGKITELRNNVRVYEDQVTDQTVLIAKLEDGINAITGEKGGMHSLKRRAAAASTQKNDNSTGGDETSNAKTADENDDDKEGEAQVQDQSGWDWGEKHQAEGLETIISEEPSMLDIIAGQRDRFRARTLELEEDNRKLMERLEKFTSDVDSLKNDNVKLYEKLRFVQSYRQSNSTGATTTPSTTNTSIPTAGRSAPIANPPGVEIPMDGSPGGDEEDGANGVLGKYRSMYEDMVNPYTLFNRRERHKRISEMSAPERLTLKASQKALATKTSRLLVFFYIIALHVLVALVLGFSSSTCETDLVTTKARH